MKKTKSLNEKMISEAFGEPNETCESCGSMLEIDSQSCTNESCSKKQVAETRKRSKWLSERKKLFLEIRDKVSETELVQTWEDLFVEAGNVTVEELASWVNATESAVMGSLPSWLVVDQQGNVVEKGGLHEASKDVEVDYIPPKKKSVRGKDKCKKCGAKVDNEAVYCGACVYID
jgi:hypothetical protein